MTVREIFDLRKHGHIEEAYKAIVPVALYGMPYQIDRIMAIADRLPAQRERGGSAHIHAEQED